MKEIDFLPEWFKKARRRRMTYQAQYGLILCILIVMSGWSFFTARSVSEAQAVTARHKLSPAQAKALEECAQIKTELIGLAHQAAALAKFDPRISIADVLAELSYLIDSRIILTQLDIQTEPLDDKAQSPSGSGLIRVNKTLSASQSAADENVRYKVVLRGMACDAGDVAALICKLEQSHYFCRITPGFSRSGKIKERQISEFEIGCYIANYKEVK